MSSTFAVAFLIGGFVWKWAERGQIRYWLIAAFLCYVIAAFWAWYRIRPDLSIEIQEVFMNGGYNPHKDKTLISNATFIVYMVNMREPHNAIKKYELEVRAAGAKLRGKIEPTTRLVRESTGEGLPDLNTTRDHILEQGHPRLGWIRFAFDRDNVYDNMKEARFVITITDVYGVEHKRKGRLPDSMDFSEIGYKSRFPDEAFGG
jgi:hypothetical protein